MRTTSMAFGILYSTLSILTVMASHTFSQKQFVPTPPEKGSFPLDHESLCKRQYLLYMNCLRRNDDNNTECRQAAKDYLGCRMDNQLMEQVQWSKLGFEDDATTKKTTTTTTTDSDSEEVNNQKKSKSK